MDMDWRQRRTIAALSTILTVLFILVLVVGGIRYHQHRSAQGGDPEQDPSSGGSAHPYTALSYSNGTTRLSFSVDPEKDQWIWADDPDFPLNDATIREICTLLTDLTPQQTLAAEEPLDSYELDQPSASLEAARADGTSLSLSFGKTTTDGTSYYALMNGDESTVYIFDGALVKKMDVAIYDMMDLPVLPALTGTNLDSITIGGAVSTTLTAQRPKGDAAAQAAWRSGGVNVTDASAVQGILEELELLTLTRCVDYSPSPEAVTICGFDEPAAEVEVSYRTEAGTEQTMTLSVGTASLDGTGRYVRLNDDTAIYHLAADGVDTLVQVAAEGLSL
ncbi:DUF4340 domain-containing protein [Dysosmobacter sp.]